LVEWYRYKRTVTGLGTVNVRSKPSDTDSETLLMAMLRVKRVEKATKMRFSFVPNLDNLSCPVARSIQHPINVEPVCNTVSNHGSLAYTCVSNSRRMKHSFQVPTVFINALFDKVKPRLRKKYNPRKTSFLVVDMLYSRGCAGGSCAGVAICASTSSSSFFKGASLEIDVLSMLYFSPSCCA
jgi:hypothetical protein